MTITTDLPARLDRLPWSRFHTLVVVALGVTWILDGLEVTLAGAVAGALGDPASLHLSSADVGFAAGAYLAGAVVGALGFGWATDRLGRKRLFFVTLFVYVAATAATAFAWDLASFAVFRFLTGAGIGGEYTAINSTIQEFTPARLRGRVDLAINGSFWIGAALGAVGSIVLLDPALLGPDLGWRVCFGSGAVLGTGIVGMRAWIPESPRWLMLRGRLDEAEAIVADIERRAHIAPSREPLPTIRLVPRDHTPWRAIATALLVTHRRRSAVGLVLMASQAFFYNAIFFTYALVLTTFYAVPAASVGWYLLPFALGNVAGPLVLGRWFDTIGRRTMIAATYAASGLLLAASGLAFTHGLFDAVDAWLRRIDHRGPLAADAATLVALHRAHLLAVPFENLDIHWGRPITLDDARHHAKIVGERRGGFCYELNGLFAWALATIGFRVHLLSAAVHGDRGWTRPAAHVLLRVDLDEPWIADVGFGENFRAPKRLVDELVQDEPPRAYRLDRCEPADEADGPMWTLSSRDPDGGWSPSYRFADTPRAITHFDAMCVYQQTSPASTFVQKRVCSRATPDGRITLSNDEWIESRLDGSRRATTVDDATWTRLLVERFGIVRPASETRDAR